ncbi:MAG: DUF6364 family protein [bacterium]
MVADYFALLGSEKPDNRQQMTPIVKSLTGVLRDKNVDIDDYHKYLEDKYL